MRHVVFILCCMFASLSAAPASKPRVLIASPVRQKPAILKEFIDSLKGLDRVGYTTDYLFIDDNESDESKVLLQHFAEEEKNHCKIVLAKPIGDRYVCTESTHEWTNDLFNKVAAFKDQMIEEAKTLNYDYLFLIDSDLVLHPKTIDQLIAANKEIISNIFWTNWKPDSAVLPQVWMMDQYTFFTKKPDETLSEEEARKREYAFLSKLRLPGIYEVGGLGACTLISKSALHKGISFKTIKNISLRGEDRHFCIRAQALGINLYVDTHFPAYHIYRESALSDVAHFKRYCALSPKASKKTKPRITLSMIMRNEASHYLRKVLTDAKEYITDAVIIDDASTDSSIRVCEEILSDIPLTIVRNQTSKFSNEIELRKQQWEETVKTNPDWIVFLDADQIFEKKFHHMVDELIANPSIDVYYFKLYDFWDESHYREDPYWQAHNYYHPFLVRYRPDIPYNWENQTAQHCGSFPSTVLKLLGRTVDIGLKHYGWATPEDREAKYKRYKQLDPDAKFGVKEQYESILDPSPNLIAWNEE